MFWPHTDTVLLFFCLHRCSMIAKKRTSSILEKDKTHSSTKSVCIRNKKAPDIPEQKDTLVCPPPPPPRRSFLDIIDQSNHGTDVVVASLYPVCEGQVSQCNLCGLRVHSSHHVDHLNLGPFFRCGSCGLRMPFSKHIDHLDLHYQHNKAARKCRGWFKCADAWLFTKDNKPTDKPQPAVIPLVECNTRFPRQCFVCRNHIPIYFEQSSEEWVFDQPGVYQNQFYLKCGDCSLVAGNSDGPRVREPT